MGKYINLVIIKGTFESLKDASSVEKLIAVPFGGNVWEFALKRAHELEDAFSIWLRKLEFVDDANVLISQIEDEKKFQKQNESEPPD